MLTDKMLTALHNGFARWEATGLFAGLRERLEVGSARVLCGLANMRRRFWVLRQARAGHPRLHQLFEEKVGYPLNLSNPISFQEKIQWRKLNDRNPLFPILADKQRAKQWIADRLGEDPSVPTLFEVRSPRDLPQDIAGRTLVLKATHASGRNIFVSPDSGLTRGDIIRSISRYLFDDYGQPLGEWAYSEVERSIIAEPVLTDETGNVPADVRFFIIGGKLRYIVYNTSALASDSHKTEIIKKAHIGPDWTSLPVKRIGDDLMPLPPRPSEFSRMKEIAETLAADLDQLRVDFFLLGEKFFVGELTLYSANGFSRIEPRSFDYELGAKWALPG